MWQSALSEEGRDDLLLVIGGLELCVDASSVNDQNATADPEYLLKLTGDEQHGESLGSHLLEGLVNGTLGRDVHSSCGFIDDEHARTDFGGPTEENLLLISSGQGSDWLSDVGKAQIDRFGQALRHLTLTALRDPTA